MNWTMTLQLIAGMLLAVLAVGSIAMGLAWVWEWCNPPVDPENNYWTPEEADRG